MVVHDLHVYIKQLLDAINTIYEFTDGISAENFPNDKKTLHACLMILVHIGEIVTKAQKHHLLLIPQGQKIVDMRNFLAHQYIDIRPSLITKTIYEDIPKLEKFLLTLLK